VNDTTVTALIEAQWQAKGCAQSFTGGCPTGCAMEFARACKPQPNGTFQCEVGAIQ
jgi:hypothetical protein